MSKQYQHQKLKWKEQGRQAERQRIKEEIEKLYVETMEEVNFAKKVIALLEEKK